MTARYREEFNNKVLRFRHDCKVRCPIHPVLVTTYGLKHNEHSDFFQNVVVQKDLFAEQSEIHLHPYEKLIVYPINGVSFDRMRS